MTRNAKRARKARSRAPGRGWTILSGAVAILLGVLIWRELPEAALWVIGTFVGIEFVFNGVTWVMLGLAVRKLPPGPAGATQAPAGRVP